MAKDLEFTAEEEVVVSSAKVDTLLLSKKGVTVQVVETGGPSGKVKAKVLTSGVYIDLEADAVLYAWSKEKVIDFDKLVEDGVLSAEDVVEEAPAEETDKQAEETDTEEAPDTRDEEAPAEEAPAEPVPDKVQEEKTEKQPTEGIETPEKKEDASKDAKPAKEGKMTRASIIDQSLAKSNSDLDAIVVKVVTGLELEDTPELRKKILMQVKIRNSWYAKGQKTNPYAK